MEDRDPLTSKVIGAAIEVHRLLGPGLLERLYHRALRFELALNGVTFESEKPVPISYKGHELGDDLRLDLIVENQLIVEIKAVDRLIPVHESQLITYMKLTGIKKGLLLNFNVRLLKECVKRMVL